jgi:ketosteroid isomerase-like protein
MKKLILFSIILLGNKLSAQGITELVETERSFARYALDHNTKEAFLKYMDTSSVVFGKGEIKNGVTTWQAKKVNTAKLIWEPAFAVLSASGELGITTGPWEFKQTMTDTALARGTFSTVWSKKDNGEWKFLADIGTDHPGKSEPVNEVNAFQLGIKRSTDPGAYNSMLQAENSFLAEYKLKGKEAYKNIADDEVWFNTAGYSPIYKKENLETALANVPDGIEFSIANSGISKAGDLGYVYGYANYKGKKENYLRVWRRTGRKWTMILQTLLI